MTFKAFIEQLKKRKSLLIIVGIFATIYGFITFVNHYNFRTFSLDLGLYTNALYDYSNFKLNDSTTFKSTAENLLADHFDLYLPLFSFLSLLFKSYTLLIIQWISILVGGIGVYKLLLAKGLSMRLSLIGLTHFYLFFGIFGALYFDYHSNVVAATIVPWFILAVIREKKITSIILLFFILIAKENMALFMVFVTAGLAIDQWKNKPVRNQQILMSICSAIYFVLVIEIIMPALSNTNQYPHFNYSQLGSSGKEALLFLIQHPFQSIEMLFTNHMDHPLGDYVKLETYVFLLLSGLPFLLKKPQYLLMILPIVFQKMFHDNHLLWSHAFQYNIEFAPILTLGVFSVIHTFKSNKTQTIVSLITLMLTFAATLRTMDRTQFWTDKSRIRIYKADHYSRNFDVKAIHKALKNIPSDVIVSAQSPIVPHLALREKIYEFPVIKGASMIVINRRENPHPMTQEVFEFKTDSLLNDKNWSVEFDNKELIILKRKAQ